MPAKGGLDTGDAAPAWGSRAGQGRSGAGATWRGSSLPRPRRSGPAGVEAPARRAKAREKWSGVTGAEVGWWKAAHAGVERAGLGRGSRPSRRLLLGPVGKGGRRPEGKAVQPA
jgi:hypothetical protein